MEARLSSVVYCKAAYFYEGEPVELNKRAQLALLDYCVRSAQSKKDLPPLGFMSMKPPNTGEATAAFYNAVPLRSAEEVVRDGTKTYTTDEVAEFLVGTWTRYRERLEALHRVVYASKEDYTEGKREYASFCADTFGESQRDLERRIDEDTRRVE